MRKRSRVGYSPGRAPMRRFGRCPRWGRTSGSSCTWQRAAPGSGGSARQPLVSPRHLSIVQGGRITCSTMSGGAASCLCRKYPMPGSAPSGPSTRQTYPPLSTVNPLQSYSNIPPTNPHHHLPFSRERSEQVGAHFQGGVEVELAQACRAVRLGLRVWEERVGEPAERDRRAPRVPGPTAPP